MVNPRVERLHPFRTGAQARPKRFHDNTTPAGIASRRPARRAHSATDDGQTPFRERIDFADFLPAVQFNNFGKARHRKGGPDSSFKPQIILLYYVLADDNSTRF